MKNNRFNYFLAMMLTLVMTSMLVSPILAAGKFDAADRKTNFNKNSSGFSATLLQSIKAQDGKTQFSPEELEQMRSALLELVDSSKEVSTLLSPDGKEKVRKDLNLEKDEDQFDEARNQIQQMTGEQLNTLRKALNPSKMRSKLAASRTAISEYKNSLAKTAADMTTNSPGLPGIDSYCGAPVSTAAIIAADAVFFVAEGVRDAAQNACNEVVVILGEGGNGRLACIATDIIYLAAKAVNQGIHFCDDDYTASVGQASFERLGHIHDDLADVKSNDNTNYNNIIGNAATNTTTITTAVTNAKNTIVANDNSNKDTIVNNDNTNKTTIVNNDNANALALTTLVNSALTQIISNANANKDETKNLLLRTQIEADLSSTDGSTFVALYETPSTVCFPSLNSFGLPQAGIPANTTQCGLLDLVRSIVSQTIVNGGNDKNALKDLATGDAQRTAGQYKSAYASYRKAYKTASK